MAIEIERKFLVVGKEWKQSPGQHYRQAYLNLDKKRTVRVRIADQQAFLCVKGMTRGALRQEFEYPIPVDDAEQLLRWCDGAILQKMRHTVYHRGFQWKIDEFLGENEGLVIAEVELISEHQNFDKPSWVGHEVTNDPRYFNSNLAVRPFIQWRNDPR
jgi:CYTH domain-containing protein